MAHFAGIFKGDDAAVSSLFPVGIRKTRGIVNNSPRPKKMKIVLKPLAGVELK